MNFYATRQYLSRREIKKKIIKNVSGRNNCHILNRLYFPTVFLLYPFHLKHFRASVLQIRIHVYIMRSMTVLMYRIEQLKKKFNKRRIGGGSRKIYSACL